MLYCCNHSFDSASTCVKSLKWCRVSSTSRSTMHAVLLQWFIRLRVYVCRECEVVQSLFRGCWWSRGYSFFNQDLRSQLVNGRTHMFGSVADRTWDRPFFGGGCVRVPSRGKKSRWRNRRFRRFKWTYESQNRSFKGKWLAQQCPQNLSTLLLPPLP